MYKEVMYICVYLLLVAVFLFLLKKLLLYIQKSNYSFDKNKSMKVLEKIVIGRDKEILIVQVEDKKYFLAFSQNAISLLKELDVKDE